MKKTGNLYNITQMISKTSLLFFVLCFLVPMGTEAQTTPKMRQVQQVISGNTLLLDGGEVVSLIGVQSPQFPQAKVEKDGKVKKPSSVAEGWARRAKEFTAGLVTGRPVWLEYGKVKKNPAGQTLAYVYFKLDSAKALGGGGEKPLLTAGSYMVNRLIIQYGMATAGAPFDYKFQSQFKQMERQARIQQIGLFQSNF